MSLMFKKLSKKEYTWFILVLVLLIVICLFSIFLLVYSIFSFVKPRDCSEKELAREAYRHEGDIKRQYTVALQSQARGSFHYSCIGTVVSKHAILTASPCGKFTKAINLGGKLVGINSTTSTEMFNVQYQNHTLIESSDLQLRIIKVPIDLTEYGVQYLHLPPLNYSVVYRGSGSIIYSIKNEMKTAIVSFVHPYYCHLTYETAESIIDFNLMICVVVDSDQPKVCLQNAIGSPLIQNGALVGLLTASRKESCGEIKRPLVFINVIPYLQWFEAHKIGFV